MSPRNELCIAFFRFVIFKILYILLWEKGGMQSRKQREGQGSASKNLLGMCPAIIYEVKLCRNANLPWNSLNSSWRKYPLVASNSAKRIAFWSVYCRVATFCFAINYSYFDTDAGACMCGGFFLFFMSQCCPINMHRMNTVNTFDRRVWLVDDDDWLPRWWDQTLLEQTGNKSDLISEPIPTSHVSFLGHMYCQNPISFIMTGYVFIWLTVGIVWVKRYRILWHTVHTNATERPHVCCTL